VSTHTIRSVLAPLQGCSGVAIVSLREEVEGGRQHAGSGRHGEEDGFERDHDEMRVVG
jgi:hypothetical protein